MKFVISKKQWKEIGLAANWIKQANTIDFIPEEIRTLVYMYYDNEYGKNNPGFSVYELVDKSRLELAKIALTRKVTEQEGDERSWRAEEEFIIDNPELLSYIESELGDDGIYEERSRRDDYSTTTFILEGNKLIVHSMGGMDI